MDRTVEPEDRTGDEEWGDWESEEPQVYSLFEGRLLPSLKDALVWDKENFDFDILDIKDKLALDFYGCIKLVNYVRTEVKASLSAAVIKETLLCTGGALLADERYLRPALEDDALLLGLGELLSTEGDEFDDDSDNDDGDGVSNKYGGKDQGQGEGEEEQKVGEGGQGILDVMGLRKENAHLRKMLEATEARLSMCSAVIQGLAGDLGEKGKGKRGGSAGGEMIEVGPDNDSYYFRSYAHWGVHETMLMDTVRTGGYKQAICGNAQFFKNMVVLDVGCGTGVLSCFAAQAGARKVIGVDRSDIVIQARDVVKANGLDNIITLLQGKVEEVDIGVDKVDVIVSEWMGYCLFYESMLPSVLFARSRYLADGGVVMPDRTPLFLQGWRDPDGRLEFWSNVYGLDYTSMANLPLGEASVEVIGVRDIVTERCLCRDFNIEEVEDKDLDFDSSFEMKVTSAGAISGLVVSFDVGFFANSELPSGCMHPQIATATCTEPDVPVGMIEKKAEGEVPFPVVKPATSWFSTGVESTPTHWKQTLLWLRPEDCPRLDVGDALIGQLSLSRNEVNPRELEVKVTWSATQLQTGKTYGGMQSYSVC